MKILTPTKLLKNLNQICGDHSPILVKPRTGKPVVLMSLEDFLVTKNLLEKQSKSS